MDEINGVPLVIACHIGDMLHTKFTRGFGKTRLFAKQNDFDIGKQSPRLDRIALNHRDVRIGEGFGGGEESDQGISSSVCHSERSDEALSKVTCENASISSLRLVYQYL